MISIFFINAVYCFLIDTLTSQHQRSTIVFVLCINISPIFHFALQEFKITLSSLIKIFFIYAVYCFLIDTLTSQHQRSTIVFVACIDISPIFHYALQSIKITLSSCKVESCITRFLLQVYICPLIKKIVYCINVTLLNSEHQRRETRDIVCGCIDISSIFN